MSEVREPVPRRVRLWVVLAASLLVLLSIMNLVLVVEAAPDVDPSVREGRTWQTGTGAPEQEGRHTWAFAVDPKGRHATELQVEVPYSVRVTHVSGSASLEHAVSFWVDGVLLHEDTARVAAADPEGNASRPVSRTHSVPGSFSPLLRIDSEDTPAGFVLLVIWEWQVVREGDADVTFQTVVRPLSVEPVDVGGLPGCGSGCARALVGGAVVLQLGSLVWYRGAPPGPGPKKDQA